MKPIIITVFFLCMVINSTAQLYTTRNGFIGFYSKTPFEDIVAENNQVYAIIDASKKSIAFSVLLRGFHFKKELMQQHFNEDYVESDKYPKATFDGSFTGADLLKQGTYDVKVSGVISLHGVSKPFATNATIIVEEKGVHLVSAFDLLPEDFNIRVPSLVKDKIAKQIHVEVNSMLSH
jgi:hypothetical protein